MGMCCLYTRGQCRHSQMEEKAIHQLWLQQLPNCAQLSLVLVKSYVLARSIPKDTYYCIFFL